jgi:hypothetical protein
MRAIEARRGEPPVSAPLLPILQALIERSYGMPRLVGDAGHFLIGDTGYRFLYGGKRMPDERGGWPARLLVRSGDSGLRAALYYPDALVRHLERHDPRLGIGDENIDAFAALVEELDHLLTLASRAADGRGVSLLELEHHANVTKYLLVMHFLGRLTGRRRVSEFHRMWARHHLFERYASGPGEDAGRYLEAARLAGRYVRILDGLPVDTRRAELLRFHRRPLSEQVRFITERG